MTAINIKDIEIISEVSEISEGKDILISGKANLSEIALRELKSNKGCLQICRDWALTHKILFVPSLNFANLKIDEQLTHYLGLEFIEAYRFLPALDKEDTPIIITQSPFDEKTLEEILFVANANKHTKIAYANPTLISSEITNIKSLLQKKMASSHVKDEEHSQVNENIIDIENIEDAAESATIYFVNNALIDALSSNASDIHLESTSKGITTRIRVNGEMKVQMHGSHAIATSSIARIKVIAGLDVSKTRQPQDGRIKVKISNKLIDLRVSSVPTLYGERIVIRFLGSITTRSSDVPYFSSRIEEIFSEMAATPNGLVVVVGPTGSGKTSTLYYILDKINKKERNVLTIEDPVEKEIDNVSQIPINASIGFDFGDALKHVLRQDPDVILIGEIRDQVTAVSSVQAAITGHLVLSTLHAPNVSSIIPRLLDMKVEPVLLSNSVKYMLSQRLAKRLCPKCKLLAPAGEFSKGPGECSKGPGCQECNETGYSGRIALIESLKMPWGHDLYYNELINLKALMKRDRYGTGEFQSMADYGEVLIAQGMVARSDLVKVLGHEQ